MGVLKLLVWYFGFTNPQKERFAKLHNDVGAVPFNWFDLTSMYVNCFMFSMIFDKLIESVNSLFDTTKWVSFVILLKPIGNVPLRKLYRKSKYWHLVNVKPRDVGIEPCNLLVDKAKYSTASNALNVEGMVPSNRLSYNENCSIRRGAVVLEQVTPYQVHIDLVVFQLSVRRQFKPLAWPYRSNSAYRSVVVCEEVSCNSHIKRMEAMDIDMDIREM